VASPFDFVQNNSAATTWAGLSRWPVAEQPVPNLFRESRSPGSAREIVKNPSLYLAKK